MSVHRREPFARALRAWLTVAFPALLAAELAAPAIPILVLLAATAVTAFLLASTAAEAILAHRPAPESISPPSTPPRWTARLTDPAPGQCPVCGMEDVAQRAAEDREYGGESVVAYGRHLAHWDCADLVPYTAPSIGVLAESSLRPAGNGFTQISGVCGLHMSCKICGDETRCGSEDELAKVVEMHRFGCWDGRTIAYVPRQLA